MATKVLVLILAIGVCAVALLSMRQARLQAAHDMARALERIQQIEHDRWAARARLGVMMDPVRIAPNPQMPPQMNQQILTPASDTPEFGPPQTEAPATDSQGAKDSEPALPGGTEPRDTDFEIERILGRDESTYAEAMP